MKKVTLVFCLSAGALLAASVTLNLYLLSSKRTFSTSESAIPAPTRTPKKDSAPAKQSAKPISWKSAEYDSYEKQLRFEFTNAGRLNLVPKDIQVTPSVPFTLETLSGGTVILRGGFKPETLYSFRIPKNISDDAGNKLDYDAAFKVRIPSLPPSIRFLTSGPYFPRNRKNTILPVALTNVNTVRVRLKQHYSNNIAVLPPDSWRSEDFTKKIRETQWNVELPKNTAENRPFDFASLIEHLKPGIYRIEMEAGAGEKYTSQSISLVLTDLSLQAATDRIGRKAFGVVRRLADNTPVSGATVELLSRKNQKIGSAVTNAEGIAEIRYLPEFQDDEDEAAMMLASREDDTTYCFLNENSHSLVSGEPDSANHFSNQPRAFVYFERGVCRPGETVRASAFLRNPAQKPVKNTPVILTLFDPMGRSIARHAAKTDDYGFVCGDFRIPENGRTGAYALRVSFHGQNTLGSTNIFAANFMPDRIRVQLEPNAPAAQAKNASRFSIRANYYFGNNVGNASAAVRVYPGKPFFPKHWHPYTVGDTKTFSPGRLFSRQLTLDNGAGNFEYPGFTAQNGSASTPFHLHAEASVNEPGGRAVTARSSLVCHPSESYLGLFHKTKKNTAERDVELLWKLFPAAPDAPLKTDGVFHWELKRKDWNYVLRSDSSGVLKRIWVQEEIPVDKGTIHLRKTEGNFLLKGLADGNYEILADDGMGRKTRLNFWHFAGENGHRSGDPSRLVFKTDKNRYTPGETAAVTFQSPGDGYVFAATGGAELASMLSYPVKTGENTIRIPLPRDLNTSSCFSGITLIAGETRCFGLLNLKISQDRRKLAVVLNTPEKAHPGESIIVQTKLLDAEKIGQAGIVQIFAVDEGILALTDYKTPDPFSFFFGTFYCPFRFADIFDGVYPDLKFGKDGRIGGDAAKASSLNPHRTAPDLKHKESAVVLMNTVWDNGNGCRIMVKMPDHVGAMRLMAVAATENQTGSASASVILRKPVTVLISAPTSAVPGDEFDLTFTVFNHEFDRKSVPLSITLPDFLKTTEPLSYDLKLKKGESQTVKLRAKTQQGTGSGAVTASVSVVNCKGTFLPQKVEKGVSSISSYLMLIETVEQACHSIRFTEAVPKITKVERVVIRPGERKKFPADTSFLKVDNIGFTFTGMRAAGLREALQFLNRYPYGCLEQRTAAAFPLLSADALNRAGILNAEEARSIDVKLEHCAAELLALMRYDGSFSMWPGGSDAWEDASIFASHFLLEADRKQKITLLPNVRKKINSHLLRLAGNASNPRGRRAYAGYVLALGKDDASLKTARDLLADKKDDYASFLAASALIRMNHAGEGAEHLERILKQEFWRENGAPYELAGPACRYGMTLALLSEFRPDAPETLRLADELRLLLKPDSTAWGTTQENAWAVCGLAQFAALAENNGNAIRGELILPKGGLPVSTETEQSFHFAGNPALEVINTGNAPMLLRIQRHGTQRVAPKDSGVLKLTKTYRNEKGEEIRSIRQGELVQVCLTLEAPGELKHLVLSDRLPGGLEIEDPLLASRSAAIAPEQRNRYDNLRLEYVEKGDGVFLLFGDILRKGSISFSYTARAVTRGTFRVPSIHAEGMYAPETQGTHTPEMLFEIQ